MKRALMANDIRQEAKLKFKQIQISSQFSQSFKINEQKWSPCVVRAFLLKFQIYTRTLYHLYLYIIIINMRNKISFKTLHHHANVYRSYNILNSNYN